MANENIKLSLKSKPSSSSYIGSCVGTKVEGKNGFCSKKWIRFIVYFGMDKNVTFAVEAKLINKQCIKDPAKNQWKLVQFILKKHIYPLIKYIIAC